MHVNGILGSLRHDINSIDSRIFGTNRFESISMKQTTTTQNQQRATMQSMRNKTEANIEEENSRDKA